MHHLPGSLSQHLEIVFLRRGILVLWQGAFIICPEALEILDAVVAISIRVSGESNRLNFALYSNVVAALFVLFVLTQA